MAVKSKESDIRMHVAKLLEFKYRKLVNEYKELADFFIDEFIEYAQSIGTTDEDILQMKRGKSLDNFMEPYLHATAYDVFKSKFFPNFDMEEYKSLFPTISFRCMLSGLSCVSNKEDQNFVNVQYSEAWLKSYLSSDAFKQDKKFQLAILGYYLSEIGIHEMDETTSFMQFALSYNTPEVDNRLAFCFSYTYCLFIPLLHLYSELILNSLDLQMVRYYESRCADSVDNKYRTYIPVHISSNAGNGGTFLQALKLRDIANWGAVINSAMDYDPRQYKAITTVEPKVSNMFYDENLLYFKNVALPFFFTYIRTMNFTIDSLEKHNFFFHYGRHRFINWFIGLPCGIAIVIFFIRMLLMTFGEI